MTRIQAETTIVGDPDEIFTFTNDLRRWPSLFDEYAEVRILAESSSGRFTRLDFELTTTDGRQWTSFRILDREERIAVAQRVAPMSPFVYLHLTWTYQPTGDGVRMVWTHDFDVDPASGMDPGTVAGYIADHARDNQLEFKRSFESVGVAGAAGLAGAAGEVGR